MHRVENDIPGQLEEVRLLLHQDSLVAALENVPDTLMALVEALGEHAIELAHALGEVRIRCLNEQVINSGWSSSSRHEPTN